MKTYTIKKVHAWSSGLVYKKTMPRSTIGYVDDQLGLSRRPYLFASSQSKRGWLVDFARQDVFFKTIISDLETFGFNLEFPLWGRSGTYSPLSLSLSGKKRDGFFNEFREIQRRGELRSVFRISPRYGRALNAHYWLHELMHFFQDQHGLFLNPLEEEKEIPALMDARSSILLTLLCEAMAETEALRASWRLKEKGLPQAWRGALMSFEWRGLALRYASDLADGFKEAEAAQRCFDRWYQTPQRLYYEKKAMKAYENNFKRHKRRAKIESALDISPYLRQVKLSAVVNSQLKEPPVFLKDVLDRYEVIKSPSVEKALKGFEAEYGFAENQNFQDIEIGSPVYIWYNQKNI